MSFLSKGRSFAVAKETAFGEGTTVFANSNYVDYTAGDMSADVESINRDVVRNSLLAVESVLGQETSSGSLTVELSGDDTINGVNGDLLYENGLGIKIPKTVGTTITSGTSATVFTVTSATGLTIGQALKVSMVGGAEYVTITDIVGTTITVSPALSGTPAGSEAIVGLTSYIIARPDTDIDSLAVREHLKSTAGAEINYNYSGCMISDVSLDFPVGGISTAAFTIGGAGFATETGASSITLPCTTRTPVVGKNAILEVDGIELEAQDVSIKIGTDITDIKAITSDGISNKVATGKNISVSFKVEYTGVDNLVRLQAGTKGTLMLQLKDGGSTSPVIVGVYMPSIKFTKVSKSEDGKIMYDNIEAQILDTGCTGNSRALTLFFA